MIIEITGRHGGVSDSLKEHARDKLDQALKHVDGIVSAHVILDSEKSHYMAEMVVYGRRLTATVHAESDDKYATVDRCADKLKHQLEKHLSKRKSRHKRGTSHEAAAEAELAAIEEERLQQEEEAAAEAELLPPVSRVSVEKVEDLTLKQASEELNAQEDSVVLFRDADSHRVSVLYRKADGSLALLDAGAA